MNGKKYLVERGNQHITSMAKCIEACNNFNFQQPHSKSPDLLTLTICSFQLAEPLWNAFSCTSMHIQSCSETSFNYE